MCQIVLAKRRFKVGEVDRLGQKIEGAAIHGGADIAHIAVGRNDDGRNLLFAFLQSLQKGQAHPCAAC